MRYFKQGGKPDENQKEIVDELRRFGAVVLIVSQVRNSFDILVFWDGRVIPMEVKMPGKKLTKGEKAFKEKIESVGCTYHVVTTPEEAIDILIK